ncbi:MAG: hypothetical protein U0703_23390 [Anaerolineae bacterium]
MSLIEVMLARKEVLISLMIVGLVLVLAIVLAVGPGIYRRWKKMSARRQAARAARQAEAAKAKAAKKQKRGRAVTPAMADEDDEAEADAETEEVAEAPAAVEQSGAKAPAPAPAEAVAAQPEPGAEGTAVEAASEEEKSEEEKEKSAGEGVASAMQDILDSVFVDDDVSGRYDVLLQGIEVGSAEELLTMASRIAAELGTKRTNRGG